MQLGHFPSSRPSFPPEGNFSAGDVEERREHSVAVAPHLWKLMGDAHIDGIEHLAFGPEQVGKMSSCLPTLPPAHATSAVQSE